MKSFWCVFRLTFCVLAIIVSIRFGYAIAAAIWGVCLGLELSGEHPGVADAGGEDGGE